MRCCIDRFEENMAVLQNEQGDCISVLRSCVPSFCKEGDWGVWQQDTFVPSAEETAEKRQSNTALLDKLLSRNK